MYPQGYSNEAQLPPNSGNYNSSGIAPSTFFTGAYPEDGFPRHFNPATQYSTSNAQNPNTMDPALTTIDLASYDKRNQASVVAPMGSSVDAANSRTQNPSTPASNLASQPLSYQSPYSASPHSDWKLISPSPIASTSRAEHNNASANSASRLISPPPIASTSREEQNNASPYPASKLISPSPIASTLRAEQNNKSPTPGSRATQRMKDAGLADLAVAGLAVVNDLSHEARPSSSGALAALEPVPFSLASENTRLAASRAMMKNASESLRLTQANEAMRSAGGSKTAEPSGSVAMGGSSTSTLPNEQAPLAEKSTLAGPQGGVAAPTLPSHNTLPSNKVASTSSINADPEGVTLGFQDISPRPSQKARRLAQKPSVESSVATSTTVSSAGSPPSSSSLGSISAPSNLAQPWDGWARRPRLPSVLESGEHREHRKLHLAIQVPNALSQSTPTQPAPLSQSVDKTNTDVGAPPPSVLGTKYNATFSPAGLPKTSFRKRARSTTPPTNSAFCCANIQLRCPPSKIFLYEHDTLATKLYTLFAGPTPIAQLTDVPYGAQVNAAEWCIEVRDIVKTVPQLSSFPPEHPANDHTKLLEPKLYMNGSDQKYYGLNEWILVTNTQDQLSLKMRLELVDCDGYERLRVGCPRHVNEYAVGIWVTPQLNAEEKKISRAEADAKAQTEAQAKAEARAEARAGKKKERKSHTKSTQEPTPKKRGLERGLKRALVEYMNQEPETPDRSSDVAFSPYGPFSGSQHLDSSPYPNLEPLEPGQPGGGFGVQMPESGQQQNGGYPGNAYPDQNQDSFWQTSSQFGYPQQSGPGFGGEGFFDGHQQIYPPSDRYTGGEGSSFAGGTQQMYGQPGGYGGGFRNDTSTGFSPYSEGQRTSSGLPAPITYQSQPIPQLSAEQTEHAVGGTQPVHQPDGPLQPPAGFNEDFWRQRRQYD